MADPKQLLPLPIALVRHSFPRRKVSKICDCIRLPDECRLKATSPRREDIEDALVLRSVQRSTERINEFTFILVLCKKNCESPATS
jgi:hypothetical protein